jgi:RNA polymerase sigma-70 factor, ECF subfamily
LLPLVISCEQDFTNRFRAFIKRLHRSLKLGFGRQKERGAEYKEGPAMPDIARLLEQEIPRLRRYARALTHDAGRADDLVQNCLLRALTKQHLWQEGTDLRAWLFTILHNLHVNEVRRAARDNGTVSAEELAAALPVDESATHSLQLRDLHRALGRLPEEQRQIILLAGLEGMRYEQIAQILDIPIGTVRSRLSRGREALRRLMGREADSVAAPSDRTSSEVARAA